MTIGDNLWKDGELESIIKSYPYVPESYIKFIKEFDGIGMSFADFYGSKHIRTPGLNPVWNVGLVDYIEELSEYTDCFKYDYFPFGKDPSGSVFAFNQKQEVVYFDIEDYLFEQEPEKIADNFEEFIEECVLGKRLDESLGDTSKHYQFLQSLGWV